MMSKLSLVMGQDIYGVGQAIADLGESNKFWEWVCNGGKTSD